MSRIAGPNDIDVEALRAATGEMPETFCTKDVSEHPIMLRAHPPSRHPYYHAFVGKRLAELTGLVERDHPQKRAGRGVRWRKIDRTRSDGAPTGIESADSAAEAAAREVSVSPDRPAVRPGHCDSLEYMASPKFKEVLKLFDRYPDIGGVYCRPVERGVILVDLHLGSPKPLIGVGEDPCIPVGSTADQIKPSMAARVAYLRDVRARQPGSSHEKRLEARMIREALGSGLRMPGLPERLRFIHSQWRIAESDGLALGVVDLIAVDLVTRRLVLIELKIERDSGASTQVESYLDYLQSKAEELNPFFTRLAQIMGKLYHCAEVEQLDSVRSASGGLVVWPDVHGGVHVEAVGELEPSSEL